jgi:PKD repeat protein
MAPAPTASFATSVASGAAPLVVAMIDTSTDIPTSWAWDLGDGTTSTLQSPSVTYAVAGTYTVTLIASNATGASAPVTQTIVVAPPVTTSPTDLPVTVPPTTPPVAVPPVTVPPTTPPVTPSAVRITRVSSSHAEVGDKVTITGKGSVRLAW